MRMEFSEYLTKLKKISTTLDEGVTNIEVQGAVVFLFIRENLFLIQRSENMNSHKGQLAFVGGHVEERDKSIYDTALREFSEETHRHTNDLHLLGVLPAVNTMKSKLIAPVLAYLDYDPAVFMNEIRSNGEWDEAIIINYEYLMDLDFWTHAKAYSNRDDYSILFRTLSTNKIIASTGNQRDHFVLWGATAKMIWNFHHNFWSKV